MLYRIKCLSTGRIILSISYTRWRTVKRSSRWLAASCSRFEPAVLETRERAIVKAVAQTTVKIVRVDEVVVEIGQFP